MLLTDEGWVSASEAVGKQVMLGTNRHGHINASEVVIAETLQHGPSSVIGTEAALGFFASGTKLRSGTGATVVIGEIIQNGSLDGVYFENILRLSKTPAVERITASLCRESAYLSESKIAIRCHAREGMAWRTLAEAGTYHFLKEEDQTFCIVDLQALRKGLAKSWTKWVTKVAHAIFHIPESEVDEFEISNPEFILWYLSALVDKSTRYHISYDSLQHSIFAFVSESNDHRSPFKLLRTSFFTGEDEPWLTITWEDRSWTPVVNGFLLGF